MALDYRERPQPPLISSREAREEAERKDTEREKSPETIVGDEHVPGQAPEIDEGAGEGAGDGREGEEEPRPQSDADSQTGDEHANASANPYEDAFVSGLVSNWGFNEDQARLAYQLLSDVGCGEIELMDGATTGLSTLDAMRGMVGKHQVNFTADNKTVFYIQITGWKVYEYDWYVNWRGKLKYGLVDSKRSFDLYDSDTVDGGYIAYFNMDDDSVIPWDER